MTTKRDLLIEIGTEELPPRALQHLARVFADEIHNGLNRHSLTHAAHHWYATPRRLAVIVNNVVMQQPDHEQVRRGPTLTAAYDEEGKPTKALQGFARSCQAGIDELETETTDKGSWVTFRSMIKGRPTAGLLPDIILAALAGLPIPRRMRWGNNDAEFVRPVHWVVALLGREVVPCTIMNCESGNESRGHRFHHPLPLKITSARNYLKKLRDKGYVIADFIERREMIRSKVDAEAGKSGKSALIDPDLLDEVTSLVEWPAAISGTFDEEFLQLPDEVILATLQEHQKYFPVADGNGALTAMFITIANIDSISPEEIRKGNERVIRPRLNDAAFFWKRDSAKPLADYCRGLEQVVYQKGLGTLADKTERLQKLAVFIASELGLDCDRVERAALLAKCDLLTDMVGEFPNLQGTMGKYYALHSGEPHEVALAIEEQYMPKQSGGALPESPAGRILSIADKLDTLAGLFGTGQQPSGDKDPFGLRRAALGMIRIFIDYELAIPLDRLVDKAFSNFGTGIAEAHTDVETFIFDRLSGYLKGLGYTALEVDAVLCLRPARIDYIIRQLDAVHEFTRLPEAESLVAANKRVANILKQADAKGEAFVDASVEELKEAAEKDLFNIVNETSEDANLLLEQGDFTGYLKCFAVLKEPVDVFFDSVMVMVEDDVLRRNRLALLRDLRNAMNKVADISRLQA